MAFFGKKNYIDMTSGPFMKKMILFAIPVLLTGLLQLAYNAADLIVVGQFSSSEAQGAIQSTGSLISLIVNVSMGLAVGVNVAVAKHVGQRDRNATSAVIHTSLVLSVIVGVVVAIFGYFLSGMFLRWMSAPTDLIDLSTTYLKIYFLGMPLNLVYNFGAAALRANGQTQKPLFYLFVSGLVNVGLNILFVLVFKMDVDGVAIATITSQAVAAVLNVCGFALCFSVLLAVLDGNGALSFFCEAVAARFSFEPRFVRAMLTGLFELGSGAAAMQGLRPCPESFSLAAFLLGWGGLSVHFQTLGVLCESGVKGALHMAGRLMSAGFAALLAYGVGMLLF